MARKQRYQRYVAKARDPERVNTSTVDQDMKLLNLQVEGLKTIWSEDEEEAAKKGKNHNAIDQDVKDGENNLQNWSASEADLTEEELAERESKFGGRSYTDISKANLANPNNPSALKIAIEGDKVTIASSLKNELIEKYGEEDYFKYINYASENQATIDKSSRFKKLAASVPTDSYSKDYFSKRGVDPEDYMSRQEVAEMHISKYTQKAKDFIDGTPLTGANTKEVTEKLSAKIDAANLPAKNREALFSHLAGKLSKQEREREQAAKRASEDLRDAFLTKQITDIKDYSILTNTDAKEVGNAQFADKSQKVEEGYISWGNFAQPPSGERAKAVYQAKYDQKVKQEYTAIKRFASDSDNLFGFKTPDNIPPDEEFAVQLAYNYFNEQKRKDPDFTIEDARSALFSKTGVQPEGQKINVQLLLTNSHRNLDELGLSKKQYMNLFRTESGRQKILDLGVQTGNSALNFLNAYQTMETNYVNTRPENERPKTN